MSFSSDVKNEMCAVLEERTCCRTAFLNAAFSFFNILSDNRIKMNTENPAVARYINLLLKSMFPDSKFIGFKKNEQTNGYFIDVQDKNLIADMLNYFGLMDGKNASARLNWKLLNEECCMYSAIRGAFVAAGSVTNPKKGYHLEFVTFRYNLANDLKELFEKLGFYPKIIVRNSNYVLYFKEKEVIADVLNLLGATQMFFRYHEIMLEKEIRNDLNRKQNFEQANLDKTVNAAVPQILAIEKIMRLNKFDDLPESLKEIARIRYENSDLSLKEIGEMLKIPITKSGVNHRMRKIMEFADGLPETCERRSSGEKI